jgi:hypothetical protein
MFISEGKLDDQLISVKIYPQYISNNSLSDYDNNYIIIFLSCQIQSKLLNTNGKWQNNFLYCKIFPNVVWRLFFKCLSSCLKVADEWHAKNIYFFVVVTLKFLTYIITRSKEKKPYKLLLQKFSLCK